MYAKGGLFLNVVALSASVVILASFTALSIAAKIAKNPRINGKTRALYLGGAAIVMGIGFWAAHVIGMISYAPYHEMQHEAGHIVFSVAVSTFSSFIAFYLALSKKASWHHLAAGGLIMGAGMVAMHLSGIKSAGTPNYATIAFNGGISGDLLAVYGVTAALFIIFLVSWFVLASDRRTLEQMAYQDPLTGLPNRNEMNRFFDTCDSQDNLGLLFLDLDHFKRINDTLGHEMGDLLVQEVGFRLHQFVRNGQQVYRIGGDEFLFIIKPCSRDRAERLAQGILRSFQKAFDIGDKEFFVTVSIGIRLGSPRESDRSILLSSADLAMYQAKRLGKNRYIIFDDSMDAGKMETMA
ncbi:diguanylate cyclase domain-containing protein [Paenibacillus macerans]|uniref:diguanylate cyclase domain-containing protein n=1 Tax=Paenibacillus macerans TaxID=44252 RepID=UPI003D31CBDA